MKELKDKKLPQLSN